MSDPSLRPDGTDEAYWRDFLVNGDPAERVFRGLFRRIPTGPRCQSCAMPFAGIGKRLLGLIGRRQSSQSPNLCNTCFDHMIDHKGGATIECTMLFADVRGSTTIAEGMSASSFHGLMARFYHLATEAVYAHDGSVDKFVGDEVVAMFFPGRGDGPASQAIAAARAILAQTGHSDPAGPWLPV